ncbi:SDR family oxidoreductase [Luteibaculum oceani]|uniref:dTDP-4-dehydrorhamnose reductase n=1 Tax=Luteibaculum oceani TaxID=1294296 RepID=A0A5C6VA55_9FLAO|nr:SDR family oxidoreductase [Luteibaculum oceani]TXC81634.1 SDR family oxidoreductase [Luteibaculum oceani]
MRILVTGANGLLGQRFLHLCLEQNIDVLATSKGESRLYNLPAVKYKSLDITNKAEIEELVHEFKPDAILNTAALTHVDVCEDNKELCWTINVDGVRNLLEICQSHNIYLSHISTDFIFDGSKGIYKEDDAPNPVNYYGESKLEAEKVLQSSTYKRVSILRTILVYGFVPNLSRTNIILWLNDTLGKKQAVNMVDDQFRMPTYADDLAHACLNACSLNAEGVFNVSGPEYISVYDLAILVADVFGHEKELINKSKSQAFSDKAPRPPKTGFDLSKSREFLNYRPHSLRDALTQTKLQIQDFKNKN